MPLWHLLLLECLISPCCVFQSGCSVSREHFPSPHAAVCHLWWHLLASRMAVSRCTIFESCLWGSRFLPVGLASSREGAMSSGPCVLLSPFLVSGKPPGMGEGLRPICLQGAWLRASAGQGAEACAVEAHWLRQWHTSSVLRTVCPAAWRGRGQARAGVPVSHARAPALSHRPGLGSSVPDPSHSLCQRGSEATWAARGQGEGGGRRGWRVEVGVGRGPRASCPLESPKLPPHAEMWGSSVPLACSWPSDPLFPPPCPAPSLSW